MWLPRDINFFLECPDGFLNLPQDLHGTSQDFTSGSGSIENCEQACENRSGCTGFEYNHGGDENFKCGTYTGGDSDILSNNSWSSDGYQKSTWTTCIKGIL